MQGIGTYPQSWDAIAFATKAEAGWRCIRCRHPYVLICDSEDEADQVMMGIVGRSKAPAAVQSIPGGGYMVRSGGLRCDDMCDDHRHLPYKRRVLTVHHFDGDKENCEWQNLGALCQVCHLTIQGRVVMDQTYMHPHTPWFRPYAAGYYAVVYLGQQLDRDEVESRLCELLILGQPSLAEFYLENV